MDTLGKRIRRAREAKDMTQDDIARHFGIKRVSVTQWESDITGPARNKIPKLARILGASEEWLLSGEGEAPKLPNVERRRQRLAEYQALFPQLQDDDQEWILRAMSRLPRRAPSS